MTRNRKKMYVVVCLALVSYGAWMVSQSGAESENQKPAPTQKSKKNSAKKDPAKAELQVFMRKKLDATSQILEGLVTDDLGLLLKGADHLKDMSSAEQWRVSNDMVYRKQSEEFLSSVEKLRKAVEDDSLDAAALAWFDTTMSCVECHKWVRRVLLAESNAPLQIPGTERSSTAVIAAE